jgi:diguanylate cyclase (GGDEF)-like protein
VSTSEDSGDGQGLPAGVTALLVQSLFTDTRSLLIGGATTALALLATAFRTGVVAILVLTLLLAATVAVRVAVNTSFMRRDVAGRPLSAVLAWEKIYSALATVHCAILGLWCFACLEWTGDGFSRLLSAVVTVGCASAIPGRNFGRVRIATLQTLALCVPLSVGWLVQGDRWYLFLAVLMMPFFAALRIMSRRLQGTLVDALTTHNALGSLAQNFGIALNNMPHGLCMVDERGKVTVANRRIFEMFSSTAQHADLAPGADSFVDLLGGEERLSEAALKVVRCVVAAGGSDDGVLTLPGGTAIALTAKSMAGGGRVVIAEDISARRAAEADILRLARTDMLTEVANRGHFMTEMKADLASGTLPDVDCAVHFIDLDKFKLVNDTLGHAYGDRLLQDVAERITRLVGRNALVGRFGGDEFVVYQPQVARPDEAALLAAAMVAAVGGSFDSGETVRPAVSVGVATMRRADADADLLIRRADLALYRAKAEGRGRWSAYDESMDREAEQRNQLELDLAGALEAGALELHYQPLFDTARLGVVSCEALLRWRHPTRGMVSPAEFIPIAEASGLIAPIGAEVLRWACAECGRWPGDLRVAVNMSPVQFAKSDVVGLIRDALAASGLAPHRLEVEITESVLLQNTDTVVRALNDIRAMGVSLSLDDFGTGHSSLSYLHKFPFDSVKMDRSFVTEVADDARAYSLLQGVSELSHKLGLRVVVEGIETQHQLDAVLGMGHVDVLQGYFLGRPLAPAALKAVLSGSKPASHPLLHSAA